VIKNKIKTLKQLQKICLNLKRKKLKVVFTNGCFDILHPGHIKYLARARALGDRLIVAINSDSSVRKIKGKTRPIFSQKARALLVGAFEFVDYVIIFSDNTPLNLIKALKPDILVKGADWQRQDMVGSKIVSSYKGKVARIAFVKGYSTSSIIAKIKKLK